MTIVHCFVFIVLVLLTASPVAFAAQGAKVRLDLSGIAAGGETPGQKASAVDDARLQAELASAGALAQGNFVPDFRRRLQVVRTSRPPVIDGLLEDEAWKDALVLADFTVAQAFNETGLPRPASDKTEARVLYDEKGIYVAVRAWQDPKTIYTTIKENGWLRPDLDWEMGGEEWANTGCDEIEVVIDGELTMASYYIFHVNPDGVRQTHYMPPVPTEGGSYKRVDPVLITDDRWRAATSRDEAGWCAEFFIPYECFGYRQMTADTPDDVYFDMVENRTVMGFNINRIAHERREPSTWSPSKGAMFFRDAGNFGNAYFRDFPASFDGVVCKSGKIEFALRSRASDTSDLTVRVTASGPGQGEKREETVSLAAGETKRMDMSLPALVPGRSKIDLRIISGMGETLDRATYLVDIPEPVVIDVMKDILYEGETDFPVLVTVNTEADEVVYRVKDAKDAVASEKRASVPGRSTLLPFEVSGLPAGEYEFQAEAYAARVSLGKAVQAFSVMADPWAVEISGTAGEGPNASGVPSGFAVLASTVGEDRPGAGYDGTTPYLDDAMKKRGYLWYAETATADYSGAGRGRRRAALPPSAFPRRAQLDAPIRAFAAGDEYEAVSFAIFALNALKNPRVEFSPLAGPSGAAIGVDQMDLRAERADTYLVKQDTLADMPAMTGRRYFLTVYVAPGTPAGKYEGTLTFKHDGAEPETRKYSLMVMPFALGVSPMTNGIYGGMYGAADRERDMVVAADLLAHGMDNPTCFHLYGDPRKVMVHHLLWDLPKPTEENWLGDGIERFSAPIDEQVLVNLKDSGLRGPFVVEVNYLLRYLPCTQENAELFEAFIRRVEALRVKYGLDEFTYHLVDEPNNHYTYDDGRYGRRYGILRVGFFGKALHAAGVRSYESMNSAGRGYDIGESVYDDMDIWCANFISDDKQVRRWTTNGKELWLYNYAGDGWCKGAMRSTYGFYALAVGATGVTIWHHPLYVGYNEEERKVCARSSWDAAREGVDDTRYAALLMDMIEKAKAAGGGRAALAEKAQADLDRILSAYPWPTGRKVEFERKHDASQWNKWRWIIADWIVRLQNGR